MPPLALGLVITSTFLHAGWNLLVRSRRERDLFLPINATIAIVGFAPAVAAELLIAPLPRQVWFFLPFSAVFEAGYFLSLARGYRSNDFTVVYPLARALPVLLLAAADVLLGHPPALLGWLGMVLVTVGCLVVPLESLRGFSWARYRNRALLWPLLTALATVGYSLTDNAAADYLPTGPLAAARYGYFEALLTTLAYWPLVRLGWTGNGRKSSPQRRRERRVGAGQAGEYVASLEKLSSGLPCPYISQRPQRLGGEFRSAVVGAALMFGAYWLVLWAYQLAEQTSYVVAMRQFSIVVGVVAGTVLFRERAAGLRIGAAMVIAAGVACIALAGG